MWFGAFNNHLKGSIPKSMKNCSTLVTVSIEGNQLTGNISQVFGIYPKLNYMDISNKKFVGKLPGSWGQYGKLTMLNISNNKVSGGLLPDLGKASQLHVLDMSSNLLAGKIPKELGQMKLLYILKLNNNKLSSNVPEKIGMLSDLEQLDLSANGLSGPIPISLEKCSKLLHLNLRSNNFSGKVPFQIGNLHALQNLDLSHNLLTGDLPMELGHLRILETFNLSNNSFSGSIPSTFKEMLSLTSIDVSNNQLEGPVPGIKAFIEAPVAALENNKGLCGKHTSLKPCPTRRKKNSDGVLILVIISISSTVTMLFILVGVMFFIWQKREMNKDEPTEAPTVTFFATWNHDGKKVHEEIIKATENFDSKYCIGIGGYGSVYKALLSTGQVVAVKKFHEDGGIASEEAFVNEISVLTRARHRNIIKLHGFCLHLRHSFLVYELMERGSLADVLRDEMKATELGWRKRVNIVEGLANALSYMHHDCSPAIIHRDITSNNALLDAEYEAHIADFGTARNLAPESSSSWSSFAGTVGYTAPELAYSTQAHDKGDVYSFGVVALEVIMGKHPGDLISSLSTPSSSSSSSPPPSTPAAHQILLKDVLDQRLSPPLSQTAEKVVCIGKLAFACLQPAPQFRLTMKEVSNKLSTLLPSKLKPFCSITLVQLLNLPT
nr:MDIS1-interacting receptor like kinase 2-like [Ziziphus jujuba var. spinosa]